MSQQLTKDEASQLIVNYIKDLHTAGLVDSKLADILTRAIKKAGNSGR